MTPNITAQPSRASCPGPLGPGAVRHRLWFERYPVATFLSCLIAALVIMPFEEQFQDGDLIDALSLTFLLLSALFAIGQRSLGLLFGLVLVLPAIAAKWINHSRPDLVSPAGFLVPGIFFVLFVTAHLLRFIFRARRIDSEVLSASIATWLMLGLLWAFAYTFISQANPGAFAFSGGPDGDHTLKGCTVIYFSFITLATVGYGDIVPVVGGARMLAMMEAMVGTFYMAILVARLVSLYTTSAPAPTIKSQADNNSREGILSTTQPNEPSGEI